MFGTEMIRMLWYNVWKKTVAIMKYLHFASVLMLKSVEMLVVKTFCSSKENQKIDLQYLYFDN